MKNGTCTLHSFQIYVRCVVINLEATNEDGKGDSNQPKQQHQSETLSSVSISIDQNAPQSISNANTTKQGTNLFHQIAI